MRAVATRSVGGSNFVEADGLAYFWAALRSRVENVVRECSLLANESIWSIQAFDTEPERIRVHGCGENSGSVELAFDSTKSVLHCRFGSSTADEHWVYYVTPDGTTLLRSGREYNLGQAVNLILDQLVSG